MFMMVSPYCLSWAPKHVSLGIKFIIFLVCVTKYIGLSEESV